MQDKLTLNDCLLVLIVEFMFSQGWQQTAKQTYNNEQQLTNQQTIHPSIHLLFNQHQTFDKDTHNP